MCNFVIMWLGMVCMFLACLCNSGLAFDPNIYYASYPKLGVHDTWYVHVHVLYYPKLGKHDRCVMWSIEHVMCIVVTVQEGSCHLITHNVIQPLSCNKTSYIFLVKAATSLHACNACTCTCMYSVVPWVWDWQ